MSTTYRAQMITRPGGPDVLQIVNLPVADPGPGELRVAVPPGWVTRAFFALADTDGVLLRGLQTDDEDLDELFHRVIQEAKNTTPDSRRGVGLG